MTQQDMPSGYGTPPVVVPPNAGRATLRRAPGGVLLPWLVSLLLLLVLAGVFSTLHRDTTDEVPTSVLETRAAIAHATAQGIRKGLDEASDDLVVLATVMGERPEREWDGLMAGFLEVHGRYQVLYLVDRRRELSHVTGEARPRAELLPDPLPTAPGLTEPGPARNLPALLAYTPLGRQGKETLLLVGRYDVTFFAPALQQTAPGTAYVTDDEARVVGSTDGFLAFQELPEPALTQAAVRASTGEPSGAFLTDGSVVAFAPVLGDSPAGRLGLSVLSSVERRALALPGNDARRLMILLAALTGLLTVLTMFWMYLFVIGPVRRVARQAERIAYGDRSEPLHVVRYDEIGLITRALERSRVLLQSAATRGR